MRRLRPRRSIVRLRTEARRRARSYGRWIYISLLVVFLAWVANIYLGDLVYLRSEGMVVAERVTVSTEFPLTVVRLNVDEGAVVDAGQRIGHITSYRVMEDLADLQANLSRQLERLSEIEVRHRILTETAELTARNAEVAETTRARFDRLHRQGLLPLDKRQEAYARATESARELAANEAERAAIDERLRELRAAVSRLRASIAALRARYNGGVLRAPVAGVVGRLPVAPGSVVLPGEPIAEIFNGPRYVEAFVPPGTLFVPEVGETVSIIHGVRSAAGVIIAVEPLSEALPDEFQRAFRPVERAQLIRIAFAPGEEAPPLFTKVKVRTRLLGAEQWL